MTKTLSEAERVVTREQLETLWSAKQMMQTMFLWLREKPSDSEADDARKRLAAFWATLNAIEESPRRSPVSAPVSDERVALPQPDRNNTKPCGECHLQPGERCDICKAVGVKPIERDERIDRTYIPLPGGWEIQTRGKGSTFRIAHVRGPDDYDRWPVLDDHLHKPLEQMARDVHSALSAAEAPPLTYDELSEQAAVEDGPRCDCGAMSEQDCNDLPSLRHCGGAGATPAPVSGEREELAKWLADFAESNWPIETVHKFRRIATALRTPHGLPGEALKFRKEHYGATVATLIDTEDTIVEISARSDGDYELIVHNREGERDTFRDCSALLKPKHFAALGTLANRLSPASREDGKNG